MDSFKLFAKPCRGYANSSMPGWKVAYDQKQELDCAIFIKYLLFKKVLLSDFSQMMGLLKPEDFSWVVC